MDDTFMNREKIRELRYHLLEYSAKIGDINAAKAAENILSKLVEESIQQQRSLVNINLHNRCLDAYAKCGKRDAYKHASNLLRKMWDRHTAYPTICPSPTSVSYNTVLDACSRSTDQFNNNSKPAKMAEELIKDMENRYAEACKAAAGKANNNNNKNNGHDEEEEEVIIQPTTISYNYVISSYANLSADTYGAANTAEDWLQYLSKIHKEGGEGEGGSNVGPDTRSFNIVLKAWKVCPEDKGADRALEMLRLMIKLYHDGFDDYVTPDPYSFGNVIQAFVDRNRPEEAEDVLRLALSFYLDDDENETDNDNNNNQDSSSSCVLDRLPQDVKPIDLRACFNIAIHGWSKSASNEGPERADNLLIDMKTLAQETTKHYDGGVVDNGNIIVQPDVYTYTSCMEAVAKSGRIDAPEMVESRLYSLLEQQQQQSYHSSSSRGVVVPSSSSSSDDHPDHDSYNNYDHHHHHPLPNAASFDCAIRCWYHSQKSNRAERMEELLNTLIGLAQQYRDDNLLPKPRTVNLCLKAWCQAGHGEDRAIPLLNRMESIRCVDSGSYVPLIVGLLDQAKKFKHNNLRTIFAASTVLEKYQIQINRFGLFKWQDSVRHHYNEVIKALGKTGDPSAADRAYVMLEVMESNKIKRAKPSTQNYTSVMLTMSRWPNKKSTHRVKNIFNHLTKLHYDETSKVRLDTSAFVAFMTYLAKTKQPWAAEHIDSLLETLVQMHMENRNDDKKLKPDYRCYDKCLQARAQCGDLVGAVARLKRFVEDYLKAKAPAVPSEIGIDIVYRCCVQDATKNGNPESAKLAQEVLDIKETLRNEGNLRLHEVMGYEKQARQKNK